MMGHYLHSQRVSGGGGSPFVVDFSAPPLSGTAPLVVQFTDLSTGSPTEWGWTIQSTTNLVQNPSFEGGSPLNSEDVNAFGHAAHWAVYDPTPPEVWDEHSDFGLPLVNRSGLPHTGEYGAYIGTAVDTPGTVSQILATTPGTTYTLSYWLAYTVAPGMGPILSSLFVVSVDGVELRRDEDVFGDAEIAAQQFTHTFTASAPATTLTFAGYATCAAGLNCAGWEIDDVSVIAAPITSTEQHPSVILGAGVYNVSLAASNGTDTGTASKAGYVTVAAGAMVIDDFNGPNDMLNSAQFLQIGHDLPSNADSSKVVTTSGTGITIGGHRKVWLHNPSHPSDELSSVTVGANTTSNPGLYIFNDSDPFTPDAVTTTATVTLIYDGGQGDPDTVDTAGLGGVDLTGGGVYERFVLLVEEITPTTEVAITVWSNSGAANGSCTVVADGVSLAFPFGDFSGAVDFADVGAIRLQFEGPDEYVVQGTAFHVISSP